MKKKLIRFLSITFILQLFVVSNLLAQDTTNLTSDELFTQARNIPKEKANYPKIISTLKLALEKSPDYADIRLFLGRVYTWNDNLDSARYQFNQVLSKEPTNIEAYSAIFDVEYWNENYRRALDHANQGLLYDPNSSELLIKKAKALNAMKDSRQALAVLRSYNKQNPGQDTVKNYYQMLRNENAKNLIDLSYEYVYFDKRFDDPWHYTSLDYTRNTSLGSITGRLMYSNRFREDGLQGEIEAYPSISKGIYAYVGAGYSQSDIFPRFRAGVSLYFSLPKSFDAETGFRYLDFNPSKTYIYVLALGKYTGNFYFNLKSYLSPDVDIFSHSYTFSARYYFSDRYNFIGAQIGAGISPDDRARNIMGEGNLSTYKFGLNYSRDIIKNFTIAATGLWFYEEYRTGLWGNQIGVGVSLIKRF
ncbi:MAG: YaiO family outer membrane beta-barrel protein [Pedobacter sp.]|uniref:YaiO family outer membrane beta-barrel protein n=1 Tax=Pedobacter sp. TaxID=1411316 RepID=UPI002808F60C|nr:YaiO family outer membrane beta-barrel protein [Pedobacter sp.]MDQ8005807.1 YaiO family outer membrane beta-barrel protein [Pedobacter sp.]